MKVFISADIEGITGVVDWSETEKGNGDYDRAAAQMQLEVAAACRGAVAGGATEIYLKDSHGTGRNLWFDGLPREVNLIRAWLSTPDSMVAGIDESFDACLCVGYHSEAGSDGSPLAHTIDHERYNWLKLNGRRLSEFEIYTLAAAKYGVPMVFISGDEAICNKAKSIVPGIETVSSKKGVGRGVISRNPMVVCEEIEAAAKKSLEKTIDLIKLEENYKLEICYKEHADAKNTANMKGVELVDEHTISYESKKIEDIIMMIDIS